ncbi:MAG: class I SAM-dependent methyltransferase [Desulfobacteraceae bacterium]|nr:class I SAM-dependent methyltransferase [Desulfobacteraceae bacterium]
MENEKPIAAGHSSFELIRPELLFPALALGENTIFLDVACGAGQYALAAARRIGPAGMVHAVDLWTEGIDRLQRAAADKGLDRIAAQVADVSRHIPLPDREADVALIATALHDLKEIGAHGGTLREIARVLKPGGLLAVVEFKTVEPPPGPPRRIRLAPEEVEEMAGPHDFRRERLLDVGPSTYLLLLRRRE